MIDKMYESFKEMTIVTLIIFHSLKNYNTATKLQNGLKLTFRCVWLQLKFLEKLGLVYSIKNSRSKVYNLTFKGATLYPLIDNFITNLNKEININGDERN